jgi:ketosteroid isomerase-like protein
MSPSRSHRRPRAVPTLLLLAAALGACRPAPRVVTEAERRAVADTLLQLVASAYDFSRPNVVERLLSLYPDTGVVVSASRGRMTTSRDSIAAGIRGFWSRVGRNMQGPRWEWLATRVDVLGPDAAVLTGTYRIPHRTPAGEPHVIGGAWTAVFARRAGRWMIVHEHLSDAGP